MPKSIKRLLLHSEVQRQSRGRFQKRLRDAMAYFSLHLIHWYLPLLLVRFFVAVPLDKRRMVNGWIYCVDRIVKQGLLVWWGFMWTIEWRSCFGGSSWCKTCRLLATVLLNRRVSACPSRSSNASFASAQERVHALTVGGGDEAVPGAGRVEQYADCHWMIDQLQRIVWHAVRLEHQWLVQRLTSRTWSDADRVHSCGS